MDLSGLPETAVDSEDDDDEEDIERASDPLMSRDIVRDCLEKDPIDRTDDDIGECLRRGPCKRVEILRGLSMSVREILYSLGAMQSEAGRLVEVQHLQTPLVSLVVAKALPWYFKKKKQKYLLKRVLLRRYLQIVLRMNLLINPST